MRAVRDAELMRQTARPSQDAPLAPGNDPRIQAGAYAVARRDRFKRQIVDRLPEGDGPEIVWPGGVNPVDFSGKVKRSMRLQLAIPRNMKRRRFIIINPDTAAETLYFSFGNNPNSLIPIAPGGVWDESGSSIGKSDIWITAQTPNHKWGAYEGEFTQE